MKLVVHIGLQKTGTTHLQTTLFSRHSAFVGSRGTRILARSEFADLTRFIDEREPHDWETASLPVPRWVAALALEVSGEESTLVSHEKLLRQPNLLKDPGGGGFPFFLERRAKHIAIFCERLAPTSTSPTIIVTIRRQPEFLASLYAQYSHGFVRPSQQDFERKTKEILRRIDEGQPSVLNFLELIRALERELPNARVLVYPLERIGTEEYLSSMAREIGLAAFDPSELLLMTPTYKRSLEENVWSLRAPKTRQRNKLRAGWQKGSLRLFDKTIEKLMDRFRETNRSIPVHNLPVSLPREYFQ